MDQPEANTLDDLLPPLLRAFDALFFISRHFHPPQFGALTEGAPAKRILKVIAGAYAKNSQNTGKDR